ncbi:VOC family protein [Nocardioides dubius]|uniref:VOC family protein n=1 Tax=Nocardioides dubius TaxID=317019 RepID=A0ABN1TTB5_9ACTN
MATLNPYLNFRGTARDALTFYQSILGGELTTSSYADMGGLEQMGVKESESQWLMHGMLVVSDSINLMGADVPTAHGDSIENGHISLSGPAEDEAFLREAFAKLAEGGELHVPLEKAPWGDYFGQTADKFGVKWLVNIAGAQG